MRFEEVMKEVFDSIENETNNIRAEKHKALVKSIVHNKEVCERKGTAFRDTLITTMPVPETDKELEECFCVSCIAENMEMFTDDEIKSIGVQNFVDVVQRMRLIVNMQVEHNIKRFQKVIDHAYSLENNTKVDYNSMSKEQLIEELKKYEGKQLCYLVVESNIRACESIVTYYLVRIVS